MTSYQRFDTVSLPNGASVVCLDFVEGAEPPVWIVEVFNAEGSMGDGVTDMWEGADGLIACDPEGLAEILRQPPNLDEPVKAQGGEDEPDRSPARLQLAAFARGLRV